VLQLIALATLRTMAIAVSGRAFKTGTDEIREAPGHLLISAPRKAGSQTARLQSRSLEGSEALLD
jgi:UDP-glucose 6-dehydrogenase